MVGISQLVGVGVVSRGKDHGGAGSIIIEKFIYDGVNNEFELNETAKQVLDVYIDNGVYPNQVPIGEILKVTIDPNYLYAGNNITIKYQI